MARAIVVGNQKGGVGKTTTVQVLGAGLAKLGYKVLLIDLDQQSNLTSCYMDPVNITVGAYDLLLRKQATEACVCHVSTNLDLIPASRMLATLDIELANKPGGENRLARVMPELKKMYDFIITDTPPSLGLPCMNALVASDEVIIPCQADLFSLRGLDQVHDTIATVIEYCNAGLKVDGILMVRHNPRSVLGREIIALLDKMAAEFNTKVFASTITECIAVREAQINRQDVLSYKPYCTASLDYKALVNEVLADGGKENLS